MRVYVRLLIVFAFAYGTAYALRHWMAPDLVPIADSELPQWRFLAAFVLKSIENVGLAGAVLVVAVALGEAMRKLFRRPGKTG